ncbi:alpha-glucuronidase family glycosyl hydrolase [Chitinophagaceae bacterium LWZ2-11]
MKKISSIIISLFLLCTSVHADDGYRLWLRYELIKSPALFTSYNQNIRNINIYGSSATIAAAKEELASGLQQMLGKQVLFNNTAAQGSVIIGTPQSSSIITSLATTQQLTGLGEEGFLILSTKNGSFNTIIITANTDRGVLYGTFRFLQLLQANQPVTALNIKDAPKLQHRILDHWDNMNRSVERGYAGFSLWKWHLLPDYIDPRYKDYARANASVGINGVVLNNVNANAIILEKEYLKKVAALADVFRPYGIKVYLTARFSAPIEIGKLKTADPLDASVQNWWKEKTTEIYQYIPDFGGFVVKANSEGQPGPQNYNRTHVDGANMLADALAPHNGIVMWRAFVYSHETPDDRFKQAYTEFKPFDGQFRKNVLLQVKNGPIDFQPREPFHPLFGAMPKSALMPEFQLTQEYLGFSTHLVYLPVLFKECLESDTYLPSKGATVEKVIEGEVSDQTQTGMAGVANIGDDRNWCGHPFAQANWYGYGRLAWNPSLNAAQIADEWIRMTFSNDAAFVEPIRKMMLASREITVDYMTPLGLHHIMGYGHHYGPAPWYDKASRPDWNPVYYHKADSVGIGFDRTSTGSNALAQYAPEVQKLYGNPETCPDDYLLWFHHVAWNYTMHSGRSLWNELCYKYYTGVDSVRWMQKTWAGLQKFVDKERFEQVKMLLNIQEKEAVWWRNACVLYFQTFSKQPIPKGYELPDKTLEYYESLQFPYAPGNN